VGLFGGKTETQPGETTAPAPRERSTPRAPASMSSEAPTVVGKDTVVKGELTGHTDMLVEGRVEGRIHGAKRVIVGESGDVEARVEAEIVIVRGKITGDCEASKKVEITATGKVFGNISARAIVVAEGATFRGASKMVPAETPRPQRPPEPARPAAPSTPSPTPPTQSRPS